MKHMVLFACAALTVIFEAMPAFAARIPAGTELNIRLTDTVATESAQAKSAIHAVLIAPLEIDGKIVVPSGAQLTGTVSEVRAAHDADSARLRFAFTQIAQGSYHADLNAVVSSIENARESVDKDGSIIGIDGAQTFSSRLNQGITKLEGNEKLSSLGALISGARTTLKIQDANPNIDFDPGAELTLKLTQPLDWTGPDEGPEKHLTAFRDEAALAALVNRQPFRTQAASPPRPSDMTNIMFIGTEQELRAAFQKAGWSEPAQLNAQSKLETARALIESRGYKEGPMSILMLDGQPPAIAWQKGNNTFAQRHHLRIFRRPDTFEGKPVWVCSSTHDTGIDFSERDRTFIHKVDSQIDRERAKVVSDLVFTGLVKSLALVDRPAVPKQADNATGDQLTTDGRMAVLLF
jgi:hypothetical protein